MGDVSGFYDVGYCPIEYDLEYYSMLYYIKNEYPKAKFALGTYDEVVQIFDCYENLMRYERI